MFEQLHGLIERFIQLTEDEKRMLEHSFTRRIVPKNTLLVSEEEIASELYFVNKGLLRLFYNKEGEYITAYIFRENLFAACYESFLTQLPGNQSLETLEDCELLVLSKQALEQLYRDLPQINVLTRKIAEQRFINGQQLLSSFLLDSPETRYRKFAAVNGDLFLRVPHHMIASYLGITPVSLSRIRKRVLGKD